MGYPLFEPLTDQSPTQAEQVFVCNRASVNAKGIYTNEGMVVLKGSTAPYETKRKTDKRMVEIRDGLLKKGVISLSGSYIVFERDYLFKTPSGASGFLLLGSSNGWVDWKTEQGVTLHEHQGRTLSLVER